MFKKQPLIFILSICLIVITTITILVIRQFNTKDIPDNYIAVFHGGAGEITYSTYIYKIDNKHPNYGFKYINTTNTTKSYGSSEREIKITGKGEVSWTDDVFQVAKENNAYSYVQLPDSDKQYTIEEYASMFLMD